MSRSISLRAARAAGFTALLLCAGSAMAHTGDLSDTHARTADFVAGLLHPWTGLDHLLAMLSVGLWSATTARRWWIPPLVFAQWLLAGAVAGMAGLAIPAVEPMVASSLIVFGLLLVTRAALPMAFATALIGLFAAFHGWAHGAELAGAPYHWQPLAGMMVSTVALHALGLAAGTWTRQNGTWSRLAGAAVALCGGAMLLQLA